MTGKIFLHTMKLLLKGKETLFLLLGGLALLLLLLFCMDEVKEEKSKISIGVVDEDETVFSSLVMERIRAFEVFEVKEAEKSVLLKQLSAGELSAVCIIRDGYMDSVMEGETDDLVLIYHTEQGTLLLPDILASAMMEEICSAKGYHIFLEYMEEKDGTLSLEEYQNYVKSYFNEEMFDFSFDIQYRSAQAEGTAPGNEVIYVQAIFAIAALMMSFLAIYAVMPYRRMCHGSMAGRVAALPLDKGAVMAGCSLGAIALTGAFATVFLLVFVGRNGLHFLDFLSFLVCTCTYICVIVAIMVLAATFLRSGQAYQMGMMVLVLVFGVFGLISIVDGLLLPEGVCGLIPNGWYVKKMMEIYLR